MPSTINADTGAITGTTGIVQTADGSGELALQANGNTVVTISTNRLANFTGNVSAGNVSVTGVVRFNDGTSMNTAASGGGGLTWQAVVTSNTTTASGNAYFVSTVSQPVIITLPSSPGAGNTVQLTDYANTWASNAVTVNRNGANISGSAANLTLSVNGATVVLTYADTARGWIPSNGYPVQPVGSYTVNYLIVAGGGGGAGQQSGYTGGGGGAGGLLTGTSGSLTPGTAYTVTVGAGGAIGSTATNGSNGANSSAISLTAFGGGGGGGGASSGGGNNANNGGSGGGGGAGVSSGGTRGFGTVGQGNDGGNGAGSGYSGSGGGAGSAGTAATSSSYGLPGNGVSSSISGSAVTYAAGGGQATSAPVNSGNGGNMNPLAGASGIVIISYQGPQRGNGGAVTFAAGNTIHTFTSSGTYTA